MFLLLLSTAGQWQHTEGQMNTRHCHYDWAVSLFCLNFSSINTIKYKSMLLLWLKIFVLHIQKNNLIALHLRQMFKNKSWSTYFAILNFFPSQLHHPLHLRGYAKVLEKPLVSWPELTPHGLFHSLLCIDEIGRLLKPLSSTDPLNKKRSIQVSTNFNLSELNRESKWGFKMRLLPVSQIYCTF